MRKTIVILLLGIATLALLGLCFVQHRTIQRLRANIGATVPAVAPAAEIVRECAEVTALKTPAKQDLPAAAAQSNATEAVVRSEPLPPTPAMGPLANAKASAATNESPMAGLASMMKNPGMKNMIRAQQKGQMDMTWGALFKYLQLPDEDLETFKNGLLDKQMALMDISLDMMNNKSTPEEKQAATKRMQEATAYYDKWIKEFLGDDDYAVYQSFEKTQPERMQVTLFKGTLNPGDQMTEEQENNLVWAMNDERTKFKYSTTGMEDTQAGDPSQYTPEKIAKLLEDTAKLQALYIARAAAILTPSQLEQFKASQKQQQAMQEMGLKMAAKMFGQSAK